MFSRFGQEPNGAQQFGQIAVEKERSANQKERCANLDEELQDNWLPTYQEARCSTNLGEMFTEQQWIQMKSLVNSPI